MHKKIRSILLIALLAVTCRLAADQRVTVTGEAAGNGKIAKQQALADALRKAVRQGAGVNIVSKSRTSDYVLDYDRIFSQAFGYVKSYSILSRGYDNTGLYTVKISALVGKGSPGMDDYLAMRQIISLKGSPRLLIRVSGTISGIGDADKLITGQLREIALKCGFQTISVSQFKEAEDRRTRRDKLLGASSSAAYREADVSSNYDFVIDAEISGAYNGNSELYGIPTQRFSLSADLGAVYSDGNAIAQLTIPAGEIDIAQVSDPVQACRSALRKMLAEDGKNFKSLLMRVLSAWVSEFDTGNRITVEFDHIDRQLFDKLVYYLKQAVGINTVEVREFDERLKSKIEVESSLKVDELGKLLASLSDNQLKVAHLSGNYIQMDVNPNSNTSNKRIFVILGGALVALIILVLMLKSLRALKS